MRKRNFDAVRVKAKFRRAAEAKFALPRKLNLMSELSCSLIKLRIFIKCLSAFLKSCEALNLATAYFSVLGKINLAFAACRKNLACAIGANLALRVCSQNLATFNSVD